MKLYVIVRRDLSPSQQAVQAGHAVAEFLLRGPNHNWTNGTLVYLGVKGKHQLDNWAHKLQDRDVPFSAFYEPDIGNEMTALATIDGQLFKNLQLL